jgi:hypothetical protein
MAYLRARRSVKLGPGVKLNLNKRSVGLTVGTRGGASFGELAGDAHPDGRAARHGGQLR